MLQHRSAFSVRRMARALDVSRSGFYAWLLVKGNPSTKTLARQKRDMAIKVAFKASKHRDGARRIQATLAADNQPCHRTTVRASMKRQNLVPKAIKKFRVTTDSKHRLPVAPNLLARDFEAAAPDDKWAGDITYLYTSEGWLYLAVVIDLYSRAVVGWSMGTRIHADLVTRALKMALLRRGFPKGVLFHSDRGSQYCSGTFREEVEKQDLVQSMSRKGDCWDNACVESFFHSLKVESIHGEPVVSRAVMRQRVFEYIEVDYNRTRRHSALGYLSPMDYERENAA